VGGAVSGGEGGSGVVGGTGAAGGTGGTVSSGGTGGRGGSGGLTGIPPIEIKCGNGKFEYDESCDDGNRFGGDCCSDTCEIEANCRCPELPEVGPCVSTVACGNGIVTSNEACDDGNNYDGDGCSYACNNVTPGWLCPAPGRACRPLCGDGIVLGGEGCDDGGRIGGDGCSSNCMVEPGWRCTAGPSACMQSACGNGVIEPGEACDLGADNGVYDGSGGGCSLTCTNEPTCVDEVCTTACGDGNVDLDEQCDDGNQFSGDGCTLACAIEAGYTCVNDERPDLTIVSVCLPRCGDEVVTVTEECDNGDAESDTDGVLNEDGAYGGCDTQCHLGPYCGDGVVFTDFDPGTGRSIEQCDKGAGNVDTYGVVGGCSPSCQAVPYCGDGVVDPAFGEICDDGPRGSERCRSSCSNVG